MDKSSRCALRLTLLAPLLAAAALAAPASAALPTFAAPVYYGAGHGPTALLAADVDGDGIPDIVTADSMGDEVGVLPGDGTGGFTAARLLGTGRGPHDVAAGDLDGDGVIDLVSANADADSVSVLLGKGAGSFAVKTDYATGERPWGVAVADFNGDGKGDVATADIGGWSVSVLLGDGAGGLLPKTRLTVGAACNGIAVGDLDDDGHADIVVSFYEAMDDSGVGVFLGDGDGGFTTMESYLTSLEPRTVAIGDMDGDGDPDIVSLDSLEGTGEISIFLGDGRGGFTKSASVRTGEEACGLALAHLDDDRRLDVLTAKGNVLAAFRGNGKGGLLKEADYAAGARPVDVAAADMRADGKLDLLMANRGSDTVGVRLAGPAAAPVIRKLLPAAGAAGTLVRLTGMHFGARRGNSAVLLAGEPATRYVSWTDKAISLRIPGGARGDVPVRVRTAVATSAARHFARR